MTNKITEMLDRIRFRLFRWILGSITSIDYGLQRGDRVDYHGSQAEIVDLNWALKSVAIRYASSGAVIVIPVWCIHKSKRV